MENNRDTGGKISKNVDKNLKRLIRSARKASGNLTHRTPPDRAQDKWEEISSLTQEILLEGDSGASAIAGLLHPDSPTEIRLALALAVRELPLLRDTAEEALVAIAKAGGPLGKLAEACLDDPEDLNSFL